MTADEPVEGGRLESEPVSPPSLLHPALGLGDLHDEYVRGHIAGYEQCKADHDIPDEPQPEVVPDDGTDKPALRLACGSWCYETSPHHHHLVGAARWTYPGPCTDYPVSLAHPPTDIDD